MKKNDNGWKRLSNLIPKEQPSVFGDQWSFYDLLEVKDNTVVAEIHTEFMIGFMYTCTKEEYSFEEFIQREYLGWD